MSMALLGGDSCISHLLDLGTVSGESRKHSLEAAHVRVRTVRSPVVLVSVGGQIVIVVESAAPNGWALRWFNNLWLGTFEVDRGWRVWLSLPFERFV